jgi:hypothetical protein
MFGYKSVLLTFMPMCCSSLGRNRMFPHLYSSTLKNMLFRPAKSIGAQNYWCTEGFSLIVSSIVAKPRTLENLPLRYHFTPGYDILQRIIALEETVLEFLLTKKKLCRFPKCFEIKVYFTLLRMYLTSTLSPSLLRLRATKLSTNWQSSDDNISDDNFEPTGIVVSSTTDSWSILLFPGIEFSLVQKPSGEI